MTKAVVIYSFWLTAMGIGLCIGALSSRRFRLLVLLVPATLLALYPSILVAVKLYEFFS